MPGARAIATRRGWRQSGGGGLQTRVPNAVPLVHNGKLMQIPIRALLAACGLVVFSVSLSAQWPDRKAARAPRLPDGSVDLKAPALRTADGKPDLSASSGRRAAAWHAARSAQPRREAGGVVSRHRRRLQRWSAPSALGQGALQKRVADNSKDNPDVWCLPMGNQQFNVHPFPRKILQTPDTLIILYETHQGLRQIFMDGRSLPTSDDLQPWFYGYSVGRWEDDTLVVETLASRTAAGSTSTAAR